MKKRLFLLFLCELFCIYVFAETVAVLDFDTDIMEYQNNMGIMTDMLRSELVKTKKVTVVDRKSMDAALQEMNMQMTDYFSESNAKALGNMLNADMLMIGRVYAFSDTATEMYDMDIEHDRGLLGKIIGNGTQTTRIPVTVENKTIVVVVQMVDVETLSVISSSTAEFTQWQDFSKYTSKIAMELVAPILKGNQIVNDILQNMSSTNSDMFEGVWSCEIYHDNIDDLYMFTFGQNGRLSVEVTSTTAKGKVTTASGSGRFTYGESENVLTLTVNILTGNITHIKSINWKSLVNPSSDETSFSCIVPVIYKGKTTNVKCDFFKE